MAKTLLLADDSVTIQRVIELTFAHEDIRVVPVGDGRRALEWMDSTTPDIVLVDVEVPEVDGYAVTTHVKSSPRLRHVPVLLLAGAFEPVDHARATRAGCDGVIVKPFEPQQLVNRVKDLLAASVAIPTGVAPALHHEEPRESARHQGDGDMGTVTPFPMPLPARAPETLEPPAAAGAFRTMRGTNEFIDPIGEPQPLEPPTRPVWESSLGNQPSNSRLPEAFGTEPSAAKISLVNAFTALLAAEQSNQSVALQAPVAAVSDATVEDAVRRVLTRMTDDLVRRIVVETAERLIKEEIEKIKASPE